jgi:hypothetical protein
VHDAGEGGQVAGAAGKYADRDGAAGRVGEQPVFDLQSAFLPSREYPRVASGQCEPSSHEEDRSNIAIRAGFAAGVRCRRTSPASIASCLPASQSIAV